MNVKISFIFEKRPVHALVDLILPTACTVQRGISQHRITSICSQLDFLVSLLNQTGYIHLLLQNNHLQAKDFNGKAYSVWNITPPRASPPQCSSLVRMALQMPGGGKEGKEGDNVLAGTLSPLVLSPHMQFKIQIHTLKIVYQFPFLCNRLDYGSLILSELAVVYTGFMLSLSTPEH